MCPPPLQVLKFLPLMIGWFSLSVPSALGLYWILNNFISTGTSVLIRKQVRSMTCVFHGKEYVVHRVC